MTDFHEVSRPLHYNCTKSSQVKKKLEQQNNDKNGGISNVLNFSGVDHDKLASTLTSLSSVHGGSVKLRQIDNLTK